MKNLILLLVLACGFLSGYLIGDYGGKKAREALQKAVVTGKTLDAERETAMSRLQSDLERVNETHRRELKAMRNEYDSRAALWQRSKDSLHAQIRLATNNLASADSRLSALISQRNSATGTKMNRLDLEIGQLRKEREALRHEVEGDACLQIQVPNTVFEALNEADTGAGAR